MHGLAVQCHSALLAHTRPTLFYIPLVNIIVSQAIMHANFHQHVNTHQFLIMVTWHFFSPSTSIYLHSQWLMSMLMFTFRYLLWSSCSVQPLAVPTGKMVFSVIKSATSGSWISSQPLKKFAQQQAENSAGFFLFWRLTMTFFPVSTVVAALIGYRISELAGSDPCCWT